MDCDGGRAAKKGEQVYISMKDYPFGVLPLANVDVNGNLVEFADMVKLPYLHEVSSRYTSSACVCWYTACVCVCSLFKCNRFLQMLSVESIAFNSIGCDSVQSQEASQRGKTVHAHG